LLFMGKDVESVSQDNETTDALEFTQFKLPNFFNP